MHSPITTLGPAELPQALRDHRLSPTLLHCLGDPTVLELPALAIVGSRDASLDALEFTEHVARIAARAGIVVVSGGARGIDGAAHEGALDGGGKTVAVLAGGLDDPYPAAHAGLFERVVSAGGVLLSEQASPSPPLPPLFIQRNRLIAGLSLAVLVVRARAKSGALSTAHWAQVWPRLLWAVPGAPWDERAVGTNALVAQGARMVGSTRDFRLALADAFGVPLAPADPAGGDDDPLLAALQAGPLSFDALWVATTSDPATVGQALIAHELAGRVRRRGDGTYDRVRP
jgi:DNA processing protein